MSAATIFPEVKDAHLQNLLFALLTSIRNGSGALVAGFVDRLATSVPANSQLSGGQASVSQAGPAREVEVTIRVNADGLSAVCKVQPLNTAGVQAQIGALDIPTLVTALAGGI